MELAHILRHVVVLASVISVLTAVGHHVVHRSRLVAEERDHLVATRVAAHIGRGLIVAVGAAGAAGAASTAEVRGMGRLLMWVGGWIPPAVLAIIF